MPTENKSYLGNQSVAFTRIAHEARTQALQAAQQPQPTTQTNQSTPSLQTASNTTTPVTNSSNR